MSPRPYRADRRKAAMDETRRRIVEATVHLHAKHGVVATTYAMVAKRADVAIPTVYNHFPTTSELLAACTGHVSAQAPALGPHIFGAAIDVDERLRALVRALFAQYRYRAPWLRWAIHEACLVPDLAKLLKAAGEGRRQLIALALAPAFGPRPPESLLILCDILLDYSAWQRLTSGKNLSGEEIETVVVAALLALVRDFAATGRPPHNAGHTYIGTRRQS